MIGQGRLDELNSITGFLVAVMEEDPLPGRRPLMALKPDDYYKVLEGYACPECLADFGGMVRLRCPVCRFERDVDYSYVKETPKLWTDHLRARRDDAPLSPIPPPTLNPEEFFRQVAADRDIEQRRL